MQSITAKFTLNCVFLLCMFSLSAQNSTDDFWLNNGFQSGETVYTNSGYFYDDGGNELYNTGQDWTVEFCSENGNPITLDFNGFYTYYNGTHPAGDDYVDFDYLTIDFTGTEQLVAYNDDTPQFSFTSPDGCIQFGFISQGEGISVPDSGWVAEISANPPPSNNDPCSAAELSVGNVCSPSFFSNKGAWDTRNLGQPSCHEFYGGDVWFSAVVPGSGDLKIQTLAGSLKYAIMVLYTGSCENLQENECIDVPESMPAYTFSGLTPGETVFIRVFGDRAKSGTFGICATDPSAGIQGYTGPGGVGDSVTNQLWLRSDMGVYNSAASEAGENDNVQLWEDQSGNENNVNQLNSTNQPTFTSSGINSFSSLVFNGTDQYMENDIGLISSPITLFSVQEFTSQDIQSVLAIGDASDDNTLSIGREAANGNYFTFSGVRHTGQPLPDEPHVIQAEYDIKMPYHSYWLNNNPQSITFTRQQITTNGKIILGADKDQLNFLNGNMAEVLLYSRILNKAQKIIVSNYLSTKYNITIANDFFAFDISHPYDLAGIGRVNQSNIHTKAQSAGLLSIGGASSLDDNEFVLFAHDGNDELVWNGENLPDNEDELLRISREWKVDITGDGPGEVTIGLDTNALPSLPPGYAAYNIIVDDDGDFSDGSEFYGLIPTGKEIVANGVELMDGYCISIVAVKTEVNFTSSESEGDESLERPVINVELSYASSDPVTVAYSVTGGTATGEGTDYSLNQDVLVFNPGEKLKEIIPLIIDDTIVEVPDEYFTISLNIQEGNAILGDTSDHTYTIIDNELSVSISATDTIVGECEESVIILTADAAGPEPLSFSWSPSIGLEDAQSQVTEAKPLENTKYVVTVTDGLGNTVKDSIEITVEASPPKPELSVTGEMEICEGDSLVISGPDGYSYMWNNGETGSEITVTKEGEYSLIINDSRCDSEPSDTIEVSVIPAPSKPQLSVSGPADFCEGDSVTLTGPEGFSYLWNTGDTTQELTVYNDGIFALQVSDSRCYSQFSDTVIVTASAKPGIPEISFTGSTDICQGDSLVLSGPDGFGYLWNTGDTTQDLAVNTSGDYSLQVFNPGCYSESSLDVNVTVHDVPLKPTVNLSGNAEFCEGDSVVLTASEGESYQWSTGSFDREIVVKTSGLYFVNVSNEFCSSPSSDTIEITVNEVPEKPVISPEGPVFLPKDGSVTLSSSIADSYLWSTLETTREIEVSGSGKFTVQVINSFNCISEVSDTVVVTSTNLLPSPDVSVSSNTEFCEGDSVILTSETASAYIWSNGDTTQSITVTEAGSYSLSVENEDGIRSLDSEPVDITVYENPDATISGEDISCFGVTDGIIEILINNVASPYSIEWSDDSSGEMLTGLSAGNYSAILTDANGCSISLATVIDEPEEITLTAELTRTRCPDASDGAISVEATGGTGMYYYEWDDGTLGTDLSELSNGTYSILVRDENNCEKSQSFTITHKSEVCFSIPDIITPNGDGFNDEWIIEGLEIYPGVVVEIYDRWGKRIFYSRGYNEKFNGMYNGKELPMESYHYIIDLKNGTPVIVGNITIVR